MKRHRKLTILALVITMVGALVATAGMAFGGSGGWSDYDDIGRLDLNLNAAGDQFVFTQSGQPAITQTLSTAGCRVNPSSGTLVSLSANGTSQPGLKDHVIGVRSASGEGNGTPCARINNSSTSPNAEILTIEFAGSIADYKADYAEIGLKLKFDATARIEAFDGATSVLSVPVLCTGGGGDCGADSGNDRKLVPINPAGNLTFNRVVISIDSPSDGSASLIDAPGYQTFFNLAGDVTAPTIILNPPEVLDLLVGELFEDPGAVVDDNFDPDTTINGVSNVPVDGAGNATTAGSYTITYNATDSSGNSAEEVIRTVNVYDGELDCGDETDVVGGTAAMEGIFRRLDNLSGICTPKPYTLNESVDEGDVSTILFDPEGDQEAAYSGIVSAPEKTGDNPTGSTLSYDPTGGFDFEAMEWCSDATIDSVTGYVTTAELPFGETWCIAAETTVTVGGGEIRTTWTVYGEDDPRMSGA